MSFILLSLSFILCRLFYYLFWHIISQTIGGQEVMDVVTKVLEKEVGIYWRTLAVRFIALASSSQSFWQNDTSELWGDRRSKRDLFSDKDLGILSHSYSGCGLGNEAFPILVGGWVFSLFLYTSKSHFCFLLVQVLLWPRVTMFSI